MKKIILLFIFVISFADYILVSWSKPTSYCKMLGSAEYEGSPTDFFQANINYFKENFCLKDKSVVLFKDNGRVFLVSDCNKIDENKINTKCIERNYIKDYAGASGAINVHRYENQDRCTYDSISYYAHLAEESVLEFCSYKDGYIYDDKKNLWKPLEDGNDIICPDGKVYSDENETCIAAPQCSEDIKCKDYEELDPETCNCKCKSPLIDDGLGNCVPNTNLSKEECEKSGGIYVKNNIIDGFSSVDNAIASFYVTDVTWEGACYTKEWVDAKKEALKAKFSPKEVLTSAIALTPIGKLFKIGRWAATTERVIETSREPKALEDNTPVIDTKYNPETGVFEPVVELEPRVDKLPPEKLFNKPATQEEAEQLVKPTRQMNDFLRSKFAEAGVRDDTTLNQAVVAYDIDTATELGQEVKIIDDLREIFKRSEIPQAKENLPVPIKNYVGRDETLEATAVREVIPISTEGEIKTYNVIYDITLKGASQPAKLTYQVEVKKDEKGELESIKATPTYQVGTSNIQSKPIVIGKTTYTTIKDNPTGESNTEEENTAKEIKEDYTSFKNPAENAIKEAFNYKVTLFSCPEVSPDCPNDLVIHYNLAGLKGEYNISDPLCAVIDTIDHPKISPTIDKASNLIVLFAGILGLLTLLRRD